MMLIASQEVAGLRRLIAAALRGGHSAQAIVTLIQRSIDSLYTPRGGFSNQDLDIAFLVKAIGGPCLLYALQKSHGLASETIIRHKLQIPRLLPSIGEPTPDDLIKNLNTFIDPDIRPPPPRYPKGIPGNILMFDGLAIESKCRYCSHRGHVMGLCREHLRNVDTKVTDCESDKKIRTALFQESDPNKKVCFGSDATVVAIAPYTRKDHYTPVPKD